MKSFLLKAHSINKRPILSNSVWHLSIDSDRQAIEVRLKLIDVLI